MFAQTGGLVSVFEIVIVTRSLAADKIRAFGLLKRVLMNCAQRYRLNVSFISILGLILLRNVCMMDGHVTRTDDRF